MNISDARQIVAAFLAGKSVAAEKFDEACSAVFADAESRKFFQDEFVPWAGNQCSRFEPCLAEFSELSPSARQREFPHLVEHLEQCGTCQWRLLQIRPLVKPADVSDSSGRSTEVWRPATDLTLFVSPRRSFEVPFGLPTPLAAASGTLGAALLGDPSEPLQGHSGKWVLDDIDRNLILELSLVPAGKDEFSFSIALLDRVMQTLSDKLQLEVQNNATKEVFYAGEMRSDAGEPILLPYGTWRIGIERGEGRPTEKWELVLTTG